MFELPRSVKLLNQVAFRLRLAAIGVRLYVAFLVCCALYAAFLIVSRMTGLWTDWHDREWLAAIPVVALIVGGLWHRRPTRMEAARAIDQRHGTKDLFLTVALIEKSAEEKRLHRQP